MSTIGVNGECEQSSRFDEIRVLHVDDEDITVTSRRFLESHLDDVAERVTVLAADDATEALEVLSETRIDCIVSDYRMPGMNGIELLEKLRTESPDLPVILFTGRGSEEVATEAFRAGATDYLQKGTENEFELLANRIRNAVSERQARRAQRYLAELAESTDRILYIFNHDWSELLFLNSAYEEIWGRSLEAIREDPTDFLEGIHPEDREMVRENMARMSAGEAITIEYRVNEAEDYGRWVEVRGEPITDDDGDVVRVAGFATDITEAKRREQEIHRAKSQLEAAVQAGTVGTWEWDVRTDRLFCGPEFAEQYGVDPEGAREGIEIEAFLAAIHDDDRDRVEAAVQAALESCGDFSEEYRIRDGEGDVRWVLARGAVDCDADGEPVTFPGVVTDITTRKRYERRLERQNERLDRFTSIVSHDLRNPLTGARGWLELAREEGDLEHLENVVSSLDRMESLIDDLLTLAQSGEAITDAEPIDLAGVVGTCWENVESRSASLEIETGLTIEGDRGQVKQLLENLLGNAIRHGGDDVRITVGDLEEVSGFYVADDGPGIPDDEREAVFEWGYSTSSEGTGFGLSIVAEVAEAHGWSVAVRESATGGARFEISGVEPPG